MPSATLRTAAQATFAEHQLQNYCRIVRKTVQNARLQIDRADTDRIMEKLLEIINQMMQRWRENAGLLDRGHEDQLKDLNDFVDNILWSTYKNRHRHNVEYTPHELAIFRLHAQWTNPSRPWASSIGWTSPPSWMEERSNMNRPVRTITNRRQIQTAYRTLQFSTHDISQ